MEKQRAWIYCRVAHPDAHALAIQQASLEAYAEANGFEIVGTLLLNRPAAWTFPGGDWLRFLMW